MMKDLLKKNLEWFYRSGVMIPENGLWGVAERVAMKENNSALERMMDAFPAWTVHEKYCIIEQRRADCNFEAAYMYLEAFKAVGDQRYLETAINILDFLYFRSGLLWRKKTGAVPGSWNWSHIRRSSVVWFDDEAWCIFLQLKIAEEFPELDKKYDMKHWGMILADEICLALKRAMVPGIEVLPDQHWQDDRFTGTAEFPHWGSLACMALARAFKEEPKAKYAEAIKAYHDYLDLKAESFDASEVCYAIIGACAAYRYTGDGFYLAICRKFGKLLADRIGDNGNIPSEHDEAPCGPMLVDTIYTDNWAILGLQSLQAIDSSFADHYRNVLNLVCSIQDNSPEPWLNGCWRGMFDMESGTWGGGDCYEGGAGSIYTGWTNAPISTVIALELQNRDLFN